MSTLFHPPLSFSTGWVNPALPPPCICLTSSLSVLLCVLQTVCLHRPFPHYRRSTAEAGCLGHSYYCGFLTCPSPAHLTYWGGEKKTEKKTMKRGKQVGKGGRKVLEIKEAEEESKMKGGQWKVLLKIDSQCRFNIETYSLWHRMNKSIWYSPLWLSTLPPLVNFTVVSVGTELSACRLKW